MTQEGRSDTRSVGRYVIPRPDRYEKAFAEYLRRHDIPLVTVDETRRAVLGGAKIKSFDMLVYPNHGKPWLVDIKGRQFPYIDRNGVRHYWENWVTQGDLVGLGEWQEVFGADFEARFVFAYHLQDNPERWPTPPMQELDQERYTFLSVPLRQYEAACRLRSPRWQTVHMPAKEFRRLAEPADRLAL